MATKTYEVRRRNTRAGTDICVARKASKAEAEAAMERMHRMLGRQADVTRYVR